MNKLIGAAGVLLASTVLAGSEVAPGDVMFSDGAVSESLSGAPGNPDQGLKIMNKGSGNCIACHQVTELQDVYPFHGEIGPSLDDVAGRYSEAELRGIVANAKVMFEGTRMPSFYKVEGFIRPGNGYTGKAAKMPIKPILSAQQIEDVVAYLMTLKEE